LPFSLNVICRNTDRQTIARRALGTDSPSFKEFIATSAGARETGCWVASSDVVGQHGDKLSHGCTCIVNPDGVVVARVTEGAEGVAIHDIVRLFVCEADLR
jgi:predicted amidohydrolase